MDGWLNGWMDGWMVEWMDGWLNGWMDGWLNGWMDEWMDEWINIAKIASGKGETIFRVHKIYTDLLVQCNHQTSSLLQYLKQFSLLCSLKKQEYVTLFTKKLRI